MAFDYTTGTEVQDEPIAPTSDIWSTPLVGSITPTTDILDPLAAPVSDYTPVSGTMGTTTTGDTDWILDLNPWGTDETAATTSSGISTTGQSLSATRTPIGSISTTTSIAPTGPAPTMADIEPLTVPETDETRISEIARRLSDPGVRSARWMAEQQLNQYEPNKMVAAMNKRNVMAGFGQSLSSVLSAAWGEGAQLEASERQMQYNVDVANANIAVNQANVVYQAAWNDYMTQYGTETTQEWIYPDETGSNINTGVRESVTMPQSLAMG